MAADPASGIDAVTQLRAPVPVREQAPVHSGPTTGADHSRLRLTLWWVGVGVAAFTLVGLPARATYGAQTTADEPQYLMTAQSLGEDLDLNIVDERYSAAYRAYHAATIPVQTELQPNGGRISPHAPLLPAILAVPMVLGGWVAAKATLAVLAGALAALTTWVGVRRLGLRVVPTALVVGVFAVSPPLAFYATQVYPELPAALAVMTAFVILTGPPGRGRALALAGAILGLPWLAVKYVPLAFVLAAAGVWWQRSARRDLALFGLALVGAGVAYVVFNRTVYGGWTPYAAGDFFVGGEATAIGPDADLYGRSPRLLGLLVDRGFGLAAWQPAYVLGIPALASAMRSRRFRMRLAVALIATGWLVAVFLAQTMHGWWWPGRQTVVVLPVVVLVIAAWVGDGSPRRMMAGLGAGIVGVASFVVLAVEATAGRLTLIVDFERTLNPLYRVWRVVLPDYRTGSVSTWLLHGLWLALVAGAVYVARRSPNRASPMGMKAGFGCPEAHC
ncbi:MAG: hypothetical protein ACE5GC_05460 [Acidimicrobiia bacterium]